jgi:hypothetical protein
MSDFFRNAEAALVSMHGKEQVIAPELLGLMKVRVLPLVNTDALGTFSGEVERQGDAYQTVTQKIALGESLCYTRLLLASEGSFGPHPHAWFLPADHEILMLKDRETGFVWKAESVSTKTNYAAADISTAAELSEFAQQALFPSHALIVKGGNDPKHWYKGIVTEEALLQTFEIVRNAGLPIRVETDMRAHLNPSRMEVIREVARKLRGMLEAECPQCTLPGWVPTAFSGHLPCEWCGNLTRLPAVEEGQCQRCTFRLSRPRSDGKRFADPSQCDVCNP